TSEAFSPEERAADPAACAPSVEERHALPQLAGAARQPHDSAFVPVDELDVGAAIAAAGDDGGNPLGLAALARHEPERRSDRREEPRRQEPTCGAERAAR